VRGSFAVLLSIAALALAEAAGAAPCQKPRQLKLQWGAANGIGQLVYVAYGCALPPGCPGKDGEPATRLPMKVTVRSGDTTLFEGEMKPCEGETCRSVNSGACAGTDAHKAAAGMVKVSYQRQGMASVMARLRAPTRKPSQPSGPVVATLTDGSGWSTEVEYQKCRFHDRPNGAILLCR